MDKRLREAIQERANGRCEYCQVPEAYDRLPFQPDHIIAEKHDGPTELDNLAWSCYDCNIFKGPNIAGVDSETGEVIQLFHPQHNNWEDHFRWNAGQLVGLTPAARATIAVLRINLERRVDFREQLIEEGVFPPAK